MTAPRVAPGGYRDIGPLAWLIAHGGGLQARTQPLNLFLTLGRHRKLFRGWLRFAGRLMPGGSLPRRETELVILRVAHLRNCEYEYRHHIRLGRRAGVTDADLARVASGADAAGWTARESALLAAVDEMNVTGDVSDDVWSRVAEHLSPRECIELVMLAGHYEMLATVISALRIAPDEPKRRLRR